jgi:hypothetical protein
MRRQHQLTLVVIDVGSLLWKNLEEGHQQRL